MGSGISDLGLPDRVDEETCRELSYDFTGDIEAFDQDAFNILADRYGHIKTHQLISWTQPLDRKEDAYFIEHLNCHDRIEFLKRFRPVLSLPAVKAKLKLKGAIHAVSTSESLLGHHRIIPNWVGSWLKRKGFEKSVSHPRLTGDGLLLTPLGEAARCGDLALCRWLFKHGADPDADVGNNFSGNTPMLLACFAGHLHICKWLYHDIKCKDILHANHDGHSPLIIAAMQGDYFICEWLYTLNKRISNMMRMIRHRDVAGFTPLSWAVRNGHDDICKWLILRGALHSISPNQTMLSDNDWGHVDINLVKRDLYPPNSKLDTLTVRQKLFIWTQNAPYYHYIFTKLVIASYGKFRYHEKKKRSYLYLFGASGYTRKVWSKIAEYAGIFYGRMLRDARELRDSIIECEHEHEVIMKRRRNRNNRRNGKGNNKEVVLAHFEGATDSSDSSDESDEE